MIQSVLDAVQNKDEEVLRSLLVDRAEYETLLWPELPDKDYTSFEFVWGLANTNSRKGLRQLLGSYGGLELELISITFGEEPETHENFIFYPGTLVEVRRKDTGQTGILESIDVLVKYRDVWKLMNYDEL